MVIKLSKTKLKNFGLVVGGTFFLIALFFISFRNYNYPIFFFISAFLIGGAIFYPYILEKPYILWMKLALFLGYINDKIILSFFFYFIFTPISLFRKIRKKDTLNRSWIKNCNSYRLKKIKRKNNHLKNQF
jgi:hypothetical protein